MPAQSDRQGLLPQEFVFLQTTLHDRPRVAGLLQQRNRVTDDQLVGGQTAIALPLYRASDNAADRTQRSGIGHELQLDRIRNEVLQRQPGPETYALQRIFDPANIVSTPLTYFTSSRSSTMPLAPIDEDVWRVFASDNPMMLAAS